MGAGAERSSRSAFATTAKELKDMPMAVVRFQAVVDDVLRDCLAAAAASVVFYAIDRHCIGRAWQRQPAMETGAPRLCERACDGKCGAGYRAHHAIHAAENYSDPEVSCVAGSAYVTFAPSTLT